jgi:hypothetical protein
MKIKKVIACSLIAISAVCFGTVMVVGQSGGKKEWNPNNGVPAFTAALSRSGYDSDFRKRLTDSCESARQAVIEDGNIAVPDNVVMMFHESGAYKDHFGFFLPPFNPKAQTPYKYSDQKFYKCCFPTPKKFSIMSVEPTLADALDRAMTRAGYDSGFRDRLSASCDSAKKAVSEEGHLEIKKEVQMVFQDTARGDLGDERYHIFHLPPFNAAEHNKTYNYEEYFEALYPVWHPDKPTPKGNK